MKVKLIIHLQLKEIIVILHVLQLRIYKIQEILLIIIQVRNLEINPTDHLQKFKMLI